MKKKEFSVSGCDKLVLIHGLVIRPDYRKLGITEEFMESMYRDFHADNVAIVALIKPIQDNPIDADYYFRHKTVLIYNKVEDIVSTETVSAMDYYKLNDLMKKKDIETNEYKLFAVAKKCGFDRINGSHLFVFHEDKILARIKYKQKFMAELGRDLG